MPCPIARPFAAVAAPRAARPPRVRGRAGQRGWSAATRFLFLVLALSLPGAGVPGDAPGGGREAMADAMSRMMEAMGLLGSGAQTNGAMPGLPAVPGMPLGQAGEAGRKLLEGMTQGVPGMGMIPGSGGALAGVWEAAGGGLLIVEGDRFRLYAPTWAFVDGTIRIAGDRVRLTSRRANFSLEFEYALDQGRLALRDPGGQILLYRQLVLDGGG